ncbi:MAG: response regulator [Nitrospinae bacterium]|nr:response regulator [Nitrospinota bacterium]
MRGKSPILIVEDNRVDVMTIERSFKQAKISNPLIITNNGEEALAYLRSEGKFAGQKRTANPCIILLDLNMPLMNGLEFLRIVKADDVFRRIPVVVLTTSKEENDRVESFNMSVAGYIIKPVDFEKFTHVVTILNLYWTLSESPWEEGL